MLFEFIFSFLLLFFLSCQSNFTYTLTVFYNRCFLCNALKSFHFIPLFFSPNCVNIRQCLLSFIFIKKKKLIFS